MLPIRPLNATVLVPALEARISSSVGVEIVQRFLWALALVWGTHFLATSRPGGSFCPIV